MSVQSASLSRVFADVASTRPLRPRVPILVYRSLDERGTHLSTTPEAFRRQMKQLASNGWHTLSIDLLLHGHAGGGWHERSFVLTFDDGYRNFRDQALSLLHAYGFSALVFLVAGRLGGANDWEGAPTRLPLLRWGDLRELVDAGMQIGAHTLTHRLLTHLPAAEAEQEIVAGKAMLEESLGQPVAAFAYPHGAADEALESIVAQHFRAGFGTQAGYATAQSRTMRFERIDMHYLQNPRLAGALDGKWLGTYLRARQSLGEIRARAFGAHV